MEQATFDLTIEDLAGRFGLQPKSLTDSRRGPVTRILETFPGRNDLTDGRYFSEFFSDILSDYLRFCGNDNSGIQFPLWQKKQWGEASESVESESVEDDGGLIPIPAVQIVDCTPPALGSLQTSIGKFNQSLENFDHRCAGIGQAIGDRVVTTIVKNAENSINVGLSDFFAQLKQLGIGN